MPRWAMAYHGIMALAGMVLGRIVQITYGQARLQSLPQDGPAPHSAFWGDWILGIIQLPTVPVLHIPVSHRIHVWYIQGIYANIWGILMVNVTIYSIHGSYGYSFFWLVSSLWLWCIHVHRNLMKFKVATVSDTNHPRRGQELVLVVPRGATLITGQSIPNNIKLEVSRDTPDHPTLDHDDSYWNNHSDDWGSPMKKLGRPLTPQVSGGLSNETFDQLLVFFSYGGFHSHGGAPNWMVYVH